MVAKLRLQFDAFDALVERVRAEGVSRWADIEADFIRAVEAFDTEFAKGEQPAAWYKTKGRYFNDLIVDLLKNASNKPIQVRAKKNSQLFVKIDIDICYPEDGEPIVAGEVKAAGTPPHPANRGRGRGGSADLHKRVREVALTSLDLKAAYAAPQAIKSFQEWVDSVSPGYFSFWAMRANDKKDLERIRSTLVSLRVYCNGVGAVVYSPPDVDAPTAYTVMPVPELTIDRLLREMSQRIS